MVLAVLANLARADTPACEAFGELRDARFERRRLRLDDPQADRSAARAAVDDARRDMHDLARSDPSLDRDLGFPCETGPSATRFEASELDVAALPLAALAAGTTLA